jgi:hypothetical protein
MSRRVAFHRDLQKCGDLTIPKPLHQHRGSAEMGRLAHRYNPQLSLHSMMMMTMMKEMEEMEEMEEMW